MNDLQPHQIRAQCIRKIRDRFGCGLLEAADFYAVHRLGSLAQLQDLLDSGERIDSPVLRVAQAVRLYHLNVDSGHPEETALRAAFNKIESILGLTRFSTTPQTMNHEL